MSEVVGGDEQPFYLHTCVNVLGRGLWIGVEGCDSGFQLAGSCDTATGAGNSRVLWGDRTNTATGERSRADTRLKIRLGKIEENLYPGTGTGGMKTVIRPPQDVTARRVLHGFEDGGQFKGEVTPDLDGSFCLSSNGLTAWRSSGELVRTFA